jgi:hypothetical protein
VHIPRVMPLSLHIPKWALLYVDTIARVKM